MGTAVQAGARRLLAWVMHTMLLLQHREGIASLVSIKAVRRTAFQLVANRSGKCPEWTKNALEVGRIGPGEGVLEPDGLCMSAHHPVAKGGSKVFEGFELPMKKLRMAFSL